MLELVSVYGREHALTCSAECERDPVAGDGAVFNGVFYVNWVGIKTDCCEAVTDAFES